jgi:hypothetical protein
MVNFYYNLTDPELIKDEFKRLNEKIEELEDADEPNTVKIEKTRDRLTQLNERLREIRAGGDAQPKLTNTIAQRQIQYALAVDKIAIAGESQIDRPDLQVEKHIRRPDKIEEPRDDEPGESTILDIRSLSLFMKKNLVSWERRRFYIDNGYLNYWLNRGGVTPDGTMYLNGATLIVMDELKAKLKTSQTWSLKAGCPFCMEQLLVILSKYKVKIVLDEGMSAETKKKLKIGVFAGAGVIAGVCAIPLALPLLGFTSAGIAAGSIAASIQSVVYSGFTGGLFSLAQSAGAAGVGAATTAAMGAAGGAAGAGAAAAAAVGSESNEEPNTTKCTCRS